MSRRMRDMICSAFCVLLAAAVAGCANVAEIGSQLAVGAGVIDSSQAAAVTRSAQAVEKTWQDLTPEQEHYVGRGVAAQLLANYQVLDAPAANEYTNLLGQSLAVFSGRPVTYEGYRFLLLDSDEVNAFAAPGGLILVTTGMVRCCASEDEFAAVLAHEIGHVEKRHGLKAIQQSRITAAGTILAAEGAKQFGPGQLAELTEQFESSVGDVVMTLSTKGYSRSQERDADRAAAATLRRAGYADGAILSMLERMEERLGAAQGLGFAKTHPSASSRADELRAEIQSKPETYDPQRTVRFRQAMKGIVD